jgi:hypothetical protein
VTLLALPYACYWCRADSDHESDDHPDHLPVIGLDGRPREGELERLQALAVWLDLVDQLGLDRRRHSA